MLQFGLGRRFLAANPAKGVRLLRGEKRERFLSDAEVASLADALEKMEAEHSVSRTMAAAIRLLRWEWVDFERGCLRLPDSKTGAKIVPIAGAAIEILTALPRTSGWVLPAARGDGHAVGLQKVWDTVRKRAALPGFRLHDLRHSFASFAVADGHTLFMVGKILGHRQTRTTEVYAHLAADPIRRAADRTGARIVAAMKSGAANEKVAPLPASKKVYDSQKGPNSAGT